MIILPYICNYKYNYVYLYKKLQNAVYFQTRLELCLDRKKYIVL